jgi:hypothetical protein
MVPPVAIGSCFGNGGGCDGATCACLSLDHDVLAQALAHFQAHSSGDVVGVATWGKALHDLDGAVWIGLCQRDHGQGQGGGSQSGEKLSA